MEHSLVRRVPPDQYVSYAGIGSRETPTSVLAMMGEYADTLYYLGYTLRSGGAAAADTAFSRAVKDPLAKEIYVPWKGFVKDARESRHSIVVTDLPRYNDIYEIAMRYHPNWKACTPGAQKLHARNVCQILGMDLGNPSQFVVCWTKDGRASGGTGQAIRIAHSLSIPVFNLHSESDGRELTRMIVEAMNAGA